MPTACQLPLCLGSYHCSHLAYQLHVTILDTIVDHLDIVASTLVTDPLAAGLSIRLGGNRLEYVLFKEIRYVHQVSTSFLP